MSAPVLLYDGTCALCAASVRFVLGHEHRSDLRFASLDGACGRRLRSRHAWLRGVDSVVWYEPAGQDVAEKLLVRSAAALEALKYIGGAWGWVGRLAAALPRPLLDRAYGALARHRHLVSGRACLVPQPSARHRFLD